MTHSIVLVVGADEHTSRFCSEAVAEGSLGKSEVVPSTGEALQRIRRGDIDIVLATLAPGDGAVLELIKQGQRQENSPEFILFDSDCNSAAALAALQLGARQVLALPCHPQLLQHAVRVCLTQRSVLRENSRLHKRVALYHRSRSLGSELEISKLLTVGLQTVLSEVDSDRGLAFVVSRDEVGYCQANLDWEYSQTEQLARCLADRLKTDNGNCRLGPDDFMLDAPLPDDLRSGWMLPLKAGDDISGAIVVFNRIGSDLHVQKFEENLELLGEHIEQGFRNASLYQGTRDLIYTDDLTGLFNHRYLKIAIEHELHRAERYGLDFSLAFIDLDLFKNVNDTHGHMAGSMLLKDVGEVLKQCVREADLLFRYGGDEFTALLVETDYDGAKIVSERIRRRLENHKFSINPQLSCKITATVGHATYPLHAKSLVELIELADRAMYQGKVKRNTICGASELRHP